MNPTAVMLCLLGEWTCCNDYRTFILYHVQNDFYNTGYTEVVLVGFNFIFN